MTELPYLLVATKSLGPSFTGLGNGSAQVLCIQVADSQHAAQGFGEVSH